MSKEKIITMGDLLSKVFNIVLEDQSNVCGDEQKDSAPISPLIDDDYQGNECCCDGCCCDKELDASVTLPQAYIALSCGEGVSDLLHGKYDMSDDIKNKIEDPNNVLVDMKGDGKDFLVVSTDIYNNIISKVCKEEFTPVSFEYCCGVEEEKEIVPFILERFTPYLIRDKDISDTWEIVVYNQVCQRSGDETRFYIDTFDGEVDITDSLDIIPLNDDTQYLVNTDDDLEDIDYMLIPGDAQ